MRATHFFSFILFENSLVSILGVTDCTKDYQKYEPDEGIAFAYRQEEPPLGLPLRRRLYAVLLVSLPKPRLGSQTSQ